MRRTSLGFVGVVCAVVLWNVLAIGPMRETPLPQPSAVFGAFVSLLQDGGVPLSFLSSGLGEVVDSIWGCWFLVEGAVTQHGVEGV